MKSKINPLSPTRPINHHSSFRPSNLCEGPSSIPAIPLFSPLFRNLYNSHCSWSSLDYQLPPNFNFLFVNVQSAVLLISLLSLFSSLGTQDRQIERQIDSGNGSGNRKVNLRNFADGHLKHVWEKRSKEANRSWRRARRNSVSYLVLCFY